MVALLLLGSACEHRLPEPDLADPGAGKATSQVGNGENPFSVSVMRRAYAKLAAHSTSTSSASVTGAAPTQASDGGANFTGEAIQPTHWYVRFKPADTDQIADLEALGFNLSWEPLNEDVAAVTPVNYTSDDIPWVYTAVPENTVLPGHIVSERIEPLFLFNEGDGDARDYDPWQPVPPPPPDPCDNHFDPSCNCYVSCAQAPPTNAPSQAQAVGGSPGGRLRSPQAKATAALKQAGISPLDLYTEALRLSGHANELAEGCAPKEEQHSATASVQTNSFCSTRYRPSGRITVQDTDLGVVPLRGVEVKSRRWFQFGSAFTNSQGDFLISTSYCRLAKLKLTYKNQLATTRGVGSWYAPWTFVLPISAEIGSFERGAMQGMSYTVSYINSADTKGANTWAASMMFNSLADAASFATARGLPAPPRDINVWLFPTDAFDSAPMLRKIATSSIVSQVLNSVLTKAGLVKIVLLKKILERQLPDVTIGYRTPNGTRRSEGFNGVAYHEMSHTQHYQQVGNNFWTVLVARVVDNSLAGRGPYGGKSDAGSGRFAVSEGWANYAERLYLQNKYGGTLLPRAATDALGQLENQIPNDQIPISAGGTSSGGWFIYGLYHDMTDTGEPSFTTVRDNVTAFTPATVFRGMQSDVSTVRDYQAKVRTQSNGLQATQMDQLVASYRY